MAIVKRGSKLVIVFKPFGEQVWVTVDGVTSMREAKQIEGALLRALRQNAYAGLDPVTRETCVRLFVNQKWELPPDLGGPVMRPQKELTLMEASKSFLDSPEIKHAQGRWRHRNSLLNILDFFKDDWPVRGLKVSDIKRYRVERQKDGVTPATVNREMSSLSRMFTFLLEEERVETNPVRMLKALSEKDGERQVYLSGADVERIAGQCPGWYQDMIRVAYCTGMRRGEIMNLRRHQVDLSKRIITLSPNDTKEGAWKRVPLRWELLPILETAMKIQAIGTDLVFLVRDKRGVRPAGKDTAKNPWKRAMESLDWPEPRPRYHDLRATWRTNARRSGMHTDLEKEIMGHETRGRSVHERYGRISDEELLKAIDGMTFNHGDTEVRVARDFGKAPKKKREKKSSEAKVSKRLADRVQRPVRATRLSDPRLIISTS